MCAMVSQHKVWHSLVENILKLRLCQVYFFRFFHVVDSVQCTHIHVSCSFVEYAMMENFTSKSDVRLARKICDRIRPLFDVYFSVFPEKLPKRKFIFILNFNAIRPWVHERILEQLTRKQCFVILMTNANRTRRLSGNDVESWREKFLMWEIN